ncbi:hypothetical protein WA588_002821 [Blastocystis sp. NMH]
MRQFSRDSNWNDPHYNRINGPPFYYPSVSSYNGYDTAEQPYSSDLLSRSTFYSPVEPSYYDDVDPYWDVYATNNDYYSQPSCHLDSERYPPSDIWAPLPLNYDPSSPYDNPYAYYPPQQMSRNDIYSRPNRFIPSHPVFPPKYHAHRSEPPTASFPRSSPFLPPDYPRETETVSRPLPLPAIMKGSPEYANVRIALDEIQRISDESSARRAYRALSRECPNCSLTWSEWSRFESDHGCIRAASAVILQGLENMPGNEVLLEKRLKLAERLGDCNGILFSAREFLSLRGGKSARNVVEAGEALAKCNRGYAASVCFHSLSKHDYLTQGSLFLDFVRFVLKSENYGEAVELLKSSLPKLSKYSPIWFYTLSVLEQDHTIFAPYGDIHARSTNQMLASFLRQALRHLPEEPKWKVFYIAAQAQLRSFTHIRLWTRTHKRFLPAFCAEYPRVVRQCLQYLHCCVQHCPTDYQWKVWLLAGRVLALAGRRKTAIQCLVRSTEIAPSRSTHAVCLELARILDFIGKPKTAGSVIEQTAIRFPEEWKIVLERVQQLLREDDIRGAYALNCTALRGHFTAGRLWSSIIQLTHQIYGAARALDVFAVALQYVSRSGEVWCEGARIFMNPTSRFFHPRNAQRCLNLAILFTPQYGDSFIEAIRLSMITSEELLYFGRSKNPCFLSYLLSARDYSPLIHKCIYSDPNYGSCWFRAKLFPLGSTEEVLFRAIKFTAHEIAVVSNVYYDAMLGYAKRQCGMETQQNRKKRREIVGVRSVRFSYPFQPYQMVARQEPLTVGKKLKVLFGTSQIES